MTITIKPVLNRLGGTTTESAVERSSAPASHLIDPALGPVSTDINSGCPEGSTVYGPAHAAVPGKDVVIEAASSAQGLVTIEDRPPGTGIDGGAEWARAASFALTADVPLAIRFTPNVGTYRVTFKAQQVANRVRVETQHR